MTDYLATADAGDPEASAAFFECMFGHRPPSPGEKAKALAEFREQRRKEFEEETARIRQRTQEMIAAINRRREERQGKTRRAA